MNKPDKIYYFFYNYDELSCGELQCILDDLEMYQMNRDITWQDTMESLFGDLQDRELEEIPEEKYIERYIVELEEAIDLAEKHEREYQEEIDHRAELETEYYRNL